MPPGLWLMFCIIFCLSTPALLGAHVLLASREKSSQSFMELTEPTQKQGVISGPRLCLWKPSGSAVCCTGVASVTPHIHRWYTGDFFSHLLYQCDVQSHLLPSLSLASLVCCMGSRGERHGKVPGSRKCLHSAGSQ